MITEVKIRESEKERARTKVRDRQRFEGGTLLALKMVVGPIAKESEYPLLIEKEWKQILSWSCQRE